MSAPKEFQDDYTSKTLPRSICSKASTHLDGTHLDTTSLDTIDTTYVMATLQKHKSCNGIDSINMSSSSKSKGKLYNEAKLKGKINIF